ncbi:MAG: type I-E CRISPR-associated endoribonuclease Cas2 [Kytococcus sp.]|nr:type I-E CRISPR-associated endoribonuclease Cas2 [Kytococcus sp.]
MVVLVLTACPVGLRGFLTRWLMEISAGVFVGRVSSRVREQLWARVEEMAKDGRAIMVHNADSEQGLDFKVLRHDWEPIDVDGIRVMLRPAPPDDLAADPGDEPPRRPPTAEAEGGLRPGWSTASRRRKAQRRK